MSLRPHPVPAVPEETARVARAAFPSGNLFLEVRDQLGAVFADQDFAPLFSKRGQPAEAPWRLALVTVMQYAEGLSDRQAADAVRSRIDWKYVLSLELTDSGFDSTVLCEFRARLLSGQVEQLMLDALLKVCREHKLIKAHGRQRTDSTSVLAAIRALNRLQCANETLRHALNSLAVVAPEWLRVNARPEWVESYGPRADDYNLPPGKEKRLARALAVGADGDTLLSAIYVEGAPAWLREVPAVETLRRVWIQQYYIEGGAVTWRTEKEGIPPSRHFISSPYDTDAHFGRKRTTQWVGYKVHLTETCDDELPRLITHVETTSAPISDGAVTSDVHRALEKKALLPSIHLVDTGYLDADLLVKTKKEFAVDLVGPTRPDYRWQAREGKGFDAHSFHIDWEQREATCPEGRKSISWTPAIDGQKNEVVKIKFSMTDCRTCPSQKSCTRGVRRTVTLRRQEQYAALQEARQRETTEAYIEEYKKRAGIEGTISQGVRAFKLRRARYIGEAKTNLQHVLTAVAMNFVRVGRWLMGEPLAHTRQTRFVRLMSQTTG